jgi:hypothetical protein
VAREKDHEIAIDAGIDAFRVDEPSVHLKKFVGPVSHPARIRSLGEALFDMVPDIASRDVLAGIYQSYLHASMYAVLHEKPRVEAWSRVPASQLL